MYKEERLDDVKVWGKVFLLELYFNFCIEFNMEKSDRILKRLNQLGHSFEPKRRRTQFVTKDRKTEKKGKRRNTRLSSIIKQ